MAYYLRQDKKKKGLYLQMYESFWDKEKKQPRSRNIESFGYVSELISDEIPDPVSYYQKYVAEKNREHAASVADETRPRVFATQLEKNIGYFLVDSLLSELNVKETVDILALQKRFQFNLYDILPPRSAPVSDHSDPPAVFPLPDTHTAPAQMREAFPEDSKPSQLLPYAPDPAKSPSIQRQAPAHRPPAKDSPLPHSYQY